MGNFVKGGVFIMLAASASVLPRATSGQQVIPVWPGPAPGSETWKQREETTGLPQVAHGAALVRNVSRPTLTAYLPDASVATGIGIVVFPGEGFRFLSWET
jgi:hypothetical protein